MFVRSRELVYAMLAAAVVVFGTACSSGTLGSPTIPTVTQSQAHVAQPAFTASAMTAGTDPELGTGMSLLPPGTDTPITAPIGLALDSSGELYIANHYASAGQILVYSAKGKQLPAREITSHVYNPAGLCFDKSGNLYEPDASKVLVNEYSPTGKWLTSIKTDKNYSPSGCAIDPATGNLWVAMRNNSNIAIGEIQVFDPTFKKIHQITANLVYPLGIAFSPTTGDAFVCNAEEPQGVSFAVFKNTGKFVKVLPLDITPGYLGFDVKNKIWATAPLSTTVNHFDQNGNDLGGAITNGVNLPYGIAINSGGDIYVANVGNNTVTEYSKSGTLLKTLTD